ncbi:MAG: FAD-binding oxidoreductase [Rhodospirillales bacterium]|nr:FAD-binding oxidoreductase [Rhodospirillales bacterium]
MQSCDVLVIGGGIAGASAAHELAADRTVVVLEQESQPGYHATGRSAALFRESYPHPTTRALAAASRDFLERPPAGFGDHPLLSPRGALLIARADRAAMLDDMAAELRTRGLVVEPCDEAAARRLVPVLRAGTVAAALYEPGACDVDVNALHQGYLRGLRARGGRLIADAAAERIERRGGRWRIAVGDEVFSAPILVNAAGAWADAVAALAGVAPLGLMPLRRTAVTFDPPPSIEVSGWPMVLDAGGAFYFKPEGGRLLASPADETPSPPTDAQPDEYDVALAIDRIEAATEITVRRVVSRWAGLRTFAPDRAPVAGFDPGAEGFFWLAGQGGTGVVTAPALARLTAALIAGRSDAALAGPGLNESALGPARLR